MKAVGVMMLVFTTICVGITLFSFYMIYLGLGPHFIGTVVMGALGVLQCGFTAHYFYNYKED